MSGRLTIHIVCLTMNPSPMYFFQAYSFSHAHIYLWTGDRCEQVRGKQSLLIL
jgi:hypothetical protein